jgi:hypothetical protein
LFTDPWFSNVTVGSIQSENGWRQTAGVVFGEVDAAHADAVASWAPAAQGDQE